MKLFLFAFFLMIVGSLALPQQSFNVENAEEREQRIVTNQIRQAIRELQKSIREAGLDPLIIESADFEETHLIVTVSAFIERFSFTGLSNIAINRLDYNILLNRLQFDLSLPELRVVIGNSGLKVTVLGTENTAKLNGTLVVTQTRLIGDVRVNIGIISGISIRSLALNFRIASIRSNLNLYALENDYSDDLNNLLNVTVPDLLTVFRVEIDTWLTNTVRQILDEILSNNLIVKDDLMLK